MYRAFSILSRILFRKLKLKKKKKKDKEDPQRAPLVFTLARCNRRSNGCTKWIQISNSERVESGRHDCIFCISAATTSNNNFFVANRSRPKSQFHAPFKTRFGFTLSALRIPACPAFSYYCSTLSLSLSFYFFFFFFSPFPIFFSPPSSSFSLYYIHLPSSSSSSCFLFPFFLVFFSSPRSRLGYQAPR